MNKKILSGSFWLSFGSIFSRVLGVVYLIPWLMMLGSYHNQINAQAIFNASYTPYALILSVGTAGLPSVIAREVSSLNSQNRYKDSVYLTKLGLMIMVVMGLLCGAILYFIAPIIAKNSPVPSVAAGTFSIRVLVPAVVILPSMSMVRGWFQGNNDMKPYGISQLWEQFSRVIFILASTFAVIEVLHDNYIVAVYFSVFGAFVGALSSYLYLFLYGRKQLSTYVEKYNKSLDRSLNNVTNSILNLWYASIPFVLLGSFVTLTQFVDQVFFKQILINFDHMSQEYVNYLYTIFSANPSKVTTVIITLATAVSETSLPILSGMLSKDDREGIRKVLIENYKLLLYVLIPVILLAAFGASSIYTVLFSHDSLGSYYMIQNIIQSIFLGLAMNSLTLLLAVRQSKRAVVYMLLALVIKLILQFPMTYLLQADGSIISTEIAFIVVIALSYYNLNHDYQVNMGPVVRIVMANVYFSLLIFAYYFLIGRHFDDLGRLSSFVYLAVYGLAFLAIYIFIANRTGASEDALGKKVGYRYYRYKHFK